MTATAVRSITHDHLLAAVLSETTKSRPAVLDIGCGAGGLLRRLAEGFEEVDRDGDFYGFDVFGTDSSHYEDFPAATVAMLERDAPGHPWSETIRKVRADQPWPVADTSVDVAVSNQVLEHVTDLEHFLAQLDRVLAPGGVSINLFPLRSIIPEGHIGVPFAHWWRDQDRREGWIRGMNRLGFGAPDGSEDYASRQARYLVEGCTYRTMRQVRAAAHAHGFSVSTRHSGRFVEQKMRQVAGKPLRFSYPAENRGQVTASTAVVRWVTSLTLVFERR